MSNNSSAIGRIGLRAITGAEVKEIIIHEVTHSVRENPAIKRFLSFHHFRLDWGYKISSLADTPVPPEVNTFVKITAEGFSDEELQTLKKNVERLKEKRAEFEPLLAIIRVVDEYLATVEQEVIATGTVSDEFNGKRQPDILRQRVGLPVYVTQQVGPRLAEVPMESPSNGKVELQKEEIKLDV